MPTTGEGMKKLLFALLLMLPVSAWANNCTCPAGLTCALSAAANWTTCGGVAPQATDNVVCTGAGSQLTLDKTGANTYVSLDIQTGCTATCSFSGAAATYNFSGTVAASWMGGNGHEFWDVHDGATLVCNGVDWTVNWTGATPGDIRWGANQTNMTPTTADANVTLRGVEKAKTSVKAFAQGAVLGNVETNFIDCVSGITAPSPAVNVGDTIVFTSGLSKEFWYKVSCPVSRCTANGVPLACCSGLNATSDCSATACGGGVCDYQLDRNATDSTPGSVASSTSWSSNTMIANLGGPTRHKTPVDNDANGTANSGGTRPVVGDSFVIFKPVLIQGGTNPITNGILALTGKGRFNVRYVEFNKLAGSHAGTCVHETTPFQSWFWDPSLAPEGDTGFLNIHNTAAIVGDWEVNSTDDLSDTNPNRPTFWSHIYLHDSDAQVPTTCPGQGVTDAFGGLVFSTDASAPLQINGSTWSGVHLARLVSGGIAVTGPQAVSTTHQWQGIIMRDVILHDEPNSATYNSFNGNSPLNLSSGAAPLYEGLSVWDLGRTSAGPGAAVCLAPKENSNVTGRPPTSARVENAFIVNVDTNAAVFTTIAGVDMSCGQGASDDTYGAIVSNSYLSRIVGASTNAGRVYFNFIKDDNIGDSGACLADRLTSVQLPVEVVGNVITRANANSCVRRGIGWKPNVAGQYTTRTHKAISNLITNLDTTEANDIHGIFIDGDGVGDTVDLDVYNNIIDMNNNFGSAGTFNSGIYDANTGRNLNVFYNTVLNCTNPGGGGCIGIFNSGGVTLNEGYNRFFNIVSDPAVQGGLAASDVDSDLQNDFVLPSVNFYMQLCQAPDKTRSPSGNPVGPLRFGIQSFDHFLPAALAVMDPDAFKMHFDWRECSTSYQDNITR